MKAKSVLWICAAAGMLLWGACGGGGAQYLCEKNLEARCDFSERCGGGAKKKACVAQNKEEVCAAALVEEHEKRCEEAGGELENSKAGNNCAAVRKASDDCGLAGFCESLPYCKR